MKNANVWRTIGCTALLIVVCFSIGCSKKDTKSPVLNGKLNKNWKVRSAHNGRSNDLSMLPEMGRNGMNSIMVSIGGHFLSDERKPTLHIEEASQIRTLNEWQKATLKNGMMFFPMIDLFGTDDQKRWPLKRKYVFLDGKKTTHMPCPGNADFWDRKFTNTYVQIARWAKGKPNIPGIVVDTEMYGADKVSFPDACFCDQCRIEIAAELSILPESIDTKDKEMLNSYRDAFTKRLTRILERVRIKVHEVYPDFLLGAYLLDHLSRSPDGEKFIPPVYKAMTMAWGTADLPVLVFSEATYEPGYHATYKDWKFGQGDSPHYIQTWLDIWKDWGAHAEFVGGFWITRIPDENLAEQIYYMSKNTRGYWLYDVFFLGENRPHKMPGGGYKAYWEAIGQGDRELDKWLQSNEDYESSLKIQQYIAPAPGVSLENWKTVELPFVKDPAPEFKMFFRNKEALVYIPAKAGDKVKFTVLADSAHPFKKKHDVVAIVVVSPDGQVVARQKINRSELDELPRADKRYGGKRTIEFKAGQTGTYGLFLNASRYAYTIGDSSHQWLAAASTWPTPGVRFFNPKEMFVKTLPGAKEAKLNFAEGNTAFLDVYDAQGVKLTRQKIPSQGGSVTIKLPSTTPQILKIEFEGGITMQLDSLEGLEPYLASSPNAPFPN